MSLEVFRSEQAKEFYRKSKEQGLSLAPWDTLTVQQFLARLEKEVAELKIAIYDHNIIQTKLECLDVSNTVWCLWEKLNKGGSSV